MLGEGRKKTRMMWGTHISKVRSKSFQDSQFNNMFLLLSFMLFFDFWYHTPASFQTSPSCTPSTIHPNSIPPKMAFWTVDQLGKLKNHDQVMKTAGRVNSQKLPRCSMYGIVAYIWHTFMINVGKYRVHGAYGLCKRTRVTDCYKVQGCDFFLMKPLRNGPSLKDKTFLE